MKSALITGANRGIGLGLIQLLTKRGAVDTIIATCRTESQVSYSPIGAIFIGFFYNNCEFIAT